MDLKSSKYFASMRYEKPWCLRKTLAISVKGKRRPANLPSIFGVPKSCLPQTYYSSSRDGDTKKVSSEARTRHTTTVPSPIDPDIIQTWESLKEHCKTLDYITDASEDEINLYKVEGTTPKIVYSLNIDSKFHVSAFKGNTRIETRDLIASLSYRLNRYSQITTILEMLESYPLEIRKEMKAAANYIKNIMECAELTRYRETSEENIVFVQSNALSRFT